MLNDHQQLVRRNAIMRIVRGGVVRKQDDLVHMLKREGYVVTQSSISRDLRDLGRLSHELGEMMDAQAQLQRALAMLREKAGKLE